MINVDILGPGRVAARFAAALGDMKNARLWSVCGRNEESLQPFIEKYQPEAKQVGYVNSEAFFHDPALDLAIIATPDILHSTHIRQAIYAKKHFLVEKPLCTDLDEAKKLLELYKASDIYAGVGCHLRWHHGLRALKDKLSTQTLGTVFHMSLCRMHHFVDEAKWRKDKEKSAWWSLTTLGTHAVDIVRCYLIPLCGDMVELKLLTSHAHHHSNDETSIISMRFESGATATVTCSILFDSPLSFEIFTEKHTIIARDLVGEMNHRSILIDHTPLPFECINNVYEDEIQDLIVAIREGRAPEVSLEEGYYNINCLHGLLPPAI